MLLELDDVTKTYGSFTALAGISVRVEPGAIGLLGPNGAGKSTLIKALLGLVSLTRGRAKVLGLDPRTENRRILEQVGYMPEDDCAIAGLKGIEAVRLVGELGGLPERTALRRAHEVLDHVTVGEERYREVDTYSTGMRQKIKLAQALVHAPRLLFLDEPTNGLDPVGREKMLALIRSLVQKAGISVVVSTHILTDVEACCDAALILGRGRLLVYDTLTALRRSVDPSCRVRVSGTLAPLANALLTNGHRVETIGPEEMQVSNIQGGGGDGELGSAVLAAAQRTGVAVREISASRTSLEDIFLTAVRATAEPANTELADTERA
jgi:ABC-2 type transport system ATP-binding protein